MHSKESSLEFTAAIWWCMAIWILNFCDFCFKFIPRKSFIWNNRMDSMLLSLNIIFLLSNKSLYVQVLSFLSNWWPTTLGSLISPHPSFAIAYVLGYMFLCWQLLWILLHSCYVVFKNCCNFVYYERLIDHTIIQGIN